MNRNVILLIVFVLMAAGAYYVYTSKKDPTTNVVRSESNFKVEDINSIGRIIITNKDGTRSDLKRAGDHWTINDQHRVRKTNIDHLLRGISRQQLDHIPTKAATENIIPSMAVNGIHVEIFDNAGAKIIGYYIGGVTQDERGTFFLKENSSQPYSLIEPGFDGSLRVRYSLRPVDWRDIRFWIEENDKIDSLKVHYPKERQHSFIIIKQGASYDVQPLFRTTAVLKNVNQVKVASYMTTLQGLACENFLPASPERDSIINSLPFMSMDIIYPGKKSSLSFFTASMPSVTKASTEVPRYFIDYNGRDFMISQHNVVKGAFRSYSYFFE